MPELDWNDIERQKLLQRIAALEAALTSIYHRCLCENRLADANRLIMIIEGIAGKALA